MRMTDLTAPLGQKLGQELGQDPTRHRRAIGLPATKIIAVALGLFLGAFVLWAAIANDPSGGEPVAVAPADLRMAKKAPEIIAVPQTAAASEAAQPTATATLPAVQPKSPTSVTVTIIDGKTGAKREVTVAAPLPATAAERTRLDQNSAATAPDQLPSSTTSQAPNQAQSQPPNRLPRKR